MGRVVRRNGGGACPAALTHPVERGRACTRSVRATDASTQQGRRVANFSARCAANATTVHRRQPGGAARSVFQMGLFNFSAVSLAERVKS